MNDMSEKATSFVHDLGDAARKNPLSAALIGMGVLWLFTNGRTAERAGDFARRSGFDRIPDAAGDAFDAARSSLRSGADSIGERISSATDSLREGSSDVLNSATRLGRDYADTASQYVSSIPETGAEMFDTIRSNLNDIFRAQPLALGAIGLAIGAGIAAALPPSEVEAAYLGDTSDSVKAKATEFASEQTDRASKVAGAVMTAVSEEVRRQGFTVEAAKSAAGDISAKVGRVVDAAGKGISEQLTPKSSSPDRQSPGSVNPRNLS
jgi:hypothetical protein